MIRILINTPKGGVGKTTFATNIALALARRGSRVWALDLAQGGLMHDFLCNHINFNNGSNLIAIDEAGGLPSKLDGASNFDYMVIDTDDYFRILTDLVSVKYVGSWKVIVPIVNEYNGLIRVPKDLAAVLKAAIFTKTKLDIKAIVNKYETQDDYNSVYNALESQGIESILGKATVAISGKLAPYFEDDIKFLQEIENVLTEVGV